MHEQIYIHPSKTQQPDGTWLVQVLITNVTIDAVTGDAKDEWLKTVEFTSRLEPQIEGVDFT